MSEGKIKIKLKNLFFSRVGTLFVMSEDSLTIEYNECALRDEVRGTTLTIKPSDLIFMSVLFLSKDIQNFGWPQ